MAIFTGSGVAIVTPMKENQDVNYEKLEELLEYQIKNGNAGKAGIFCGTGSAGRGRGEAAAVA